MKLDRKKNLAARTIGVGTDRIIFNEKRLEEIKEAITKQDIRELVSDRAIIVKTPTGRRKLRKNKSRRRAGSIRKKVDGRKRTYINITRKLRGYLFSLKSRNSLTQENYRKLRKEIRARQFKSKAQLKERILSMEKKK